MTRAAALLGSIAHRIDRALGAVLRPIGLGLVRGSIVVGVLLAALCGLLVSGTVRALEARPEPIPAHLTEVAGTGVSSGLWVTFPALVNLAARPVTVPLYSGGALVGEVERLHYLARDPDGGAEAVILRAQEPLARTVTARVEVDPEGTAALARALGAGRPLADRHVGELPPGDAPAGDGPAAVGVDGLGGQSSGAEVVVSGRVLAVAPDPDRPGGSLQLLGEPSGGAVILRSPHPADAVPLDVTGTIVFDPTNVDRVVTGWDVVEGSQADVDSQRLVAVDFAPAYQEPSWLPAIAVGLVTALVLAGALVRYPLFRPAPAPSSGALGSGETISVQLFGTLPSPRGVVRLDGVRGQLERMPVAEAARTRWRYWGGQVGDLRRDMEAAVARTGRGEDLVVQSLAGGVFWEARPDTAVEVAGGELHLGRRVVPGIRLRGPGLRAILAFATGDDRDRSLAELRSAVAAEPRAS